MRIALAAAAAISVFAVPAQAATIVNGSFEQGSAGSTFTTYNAGSSGVTGWTIVSGSVDLIGGYWQPSAGSQSLDLAGNSVGAIEQAIATVIGTTYRVTFDLSKNPDGGATPRQVQVTAANASQTFGYSTPNSEAAMNWQSQAFNFTATGSTTNLRFTALNDGPYGPALDKVAIQTVSAAAVPEAATWSMMIVGFGLVGGAVRRRARTALAA